MSFSLHDRLFSYQPFWNGWYLNQDVFLDRFPNVYKVLNKDSEKYAILKAFTINIETFSKTLKCSYDEVKDNLVKIINSIMKVNILKDCDNVAKYNDVLIKEILQEGQLIGYDVIFKIDNIDCLFSRVKENVKFTENDVITMLYDISNVLSIAHIKGLIHKYINLQTIFLDDYHSYKLGDFGIYSLLSNSKDITYLAPEVLNSKRSSIQSDIYSLGLVAYQLLNENHFTKASSNGTLPTIKGVNPILMSIVQKMCATEPSKRYASINALITDLNSMDIKPHIESSTVSEIVKVSVKPVENVKASLEETPKKAENVEIEVLSSNAKDDFNILPSIIACIVIGFVVYIFGNMLYRTLTNSIDSEPSNNVVQNSIETATTISTTTVPVSTITSTDYTTYSHVVLTVTEETAIPTTTTTTTFTTEPVTTITIPITTMTTTLPVTTISKVTTTTLQTTTTSLNTTTSITKAENVKHNYYFKKGSYTWEEAYNDALANGYQLATFTNGDELNAIKSVAKSSGLKYFWLGGKVEIYTDDNNNSYALCYWNNGDDSSYINIIDSKWYYSDKYQIQEPSGWDINTHEIEPYIMLWYLDDWTLCDNGVNACSDGSISGYIYMD